MIKNPAPEGVLPAINLAVSAKGSGRSIDGTAPVRFLDIGSTRAVDLFQGRDGIDRERIRCDTDNGTCRCLC
jgi:hypothetical protein